MSIFMKLTHQRLSINSLINTIEMLTSNVGYNSKKSPVTTPTSEHEVST